jgi:hypothetical protein
VLVLAAACPAVAVAGSGIVRSQRIDRIDIVGVGCGVAGSAIVPLPATATDVRVLAPRVRATADESRLTEVAVEGASVRLTAVGAGEDICDPETVDELPPDERGWSDNYGYDFRFRERVSVGSWAGADLTRGKPVLSPRSVTIPDVARAVRIAGGRSAGAGRSASPACEASHRT